MNGNKAIDNFEVHKHFFDDDDHLYAYVSNNGRGCWWNIDLEGFHELPFDYQSEDEVKAAIIKHMQNENFDPAKLPSIEEADPVLKQLWDNLCESENNMWFVDNDAPDYEHAVWTEDFNISKEEYIRRLDSEIKKYHLENVIEKDAGDLLYTCYSDLQCRFSEAIEPTLIKKEDYEDKNLTQTVVDNLEEQAATLLEHIRDIKDMDNNHRSESVSLLMKDIEVLHEEIEHYSKCVIEDNRNEDLLYEYPNKTLQSLSPNDTVASKGLDGVKCSIIKHEFLPEHNMRCLLVQPVGAEPTWVTYTNLVIPCDDPVKISNLNDFGVVSQEQLEKIKRIYDLKFSKPQNIEECFAEGFKSLISQINDMNFVLDSLRVSCMDGMNNVFDRYGSQALTDDNLAKLNNIIPDLSVLELRIYRMSQKVHEIAINRDADTLHGAFSRGFLGNEYDVLMSERAYTDCHTMEMYSLYDVINKNTMERIEPSEYEHLSVKGLENVLRSSNAKDNNLINDTQKLTKIVSDMCPTAAFTNSYGRVKLLDSIVRKARVAVKGDNRFKNLRY